MANAPVNPGSYGSSPTTATTNPTPAPAAAPTSVTGGSFPQSPQGTGLGANGIPVANITVAQFLSNYHISTTEQNTYLTQGSKGQPALNENAYFLMQYQAMTPEERQTYQEALVNAGLLTASNANGIYNAASVAAFKNGISAAANQGTTVDQYLNQYTGTNNVNTALAAATGRAEQQAAAPTTATLENPTTLAAQITAAFDQTVGYAPSQDQVNAFISQMQTQDVANAQAPHEAAVSQLAQLKSDQSALTKLGPNGIDAVVSAYMNAVHGINPAAGNPANQQGVPNGQVPAPGFAKTPVAGTNTPAQTVTTHGTEGVMGALGHNLGQMGSDIIHGNVGGLVNSTGTVSPGSQTTQTHTIPGTSTPALAAPSNNPSSIVGSMSQVAGPSYGGVYALTPADWAEAKKLMPNSKLPATPGAATPAEQQVAFKTLLQNVYDNNGGSWADAIITIAGGKIGQAANEKELGSSTNLQSFATNIASQVNDQLNQLTNTINTQNVTEKVMTPDAAAEANLAAKTADPVGYYAANAASAGQLLNQMLAGAPQMYGQTTADAFTGPVTPNGVSAGAATTPTTVAA